MVAQIQSLAVNPASVETTNWRSTRYKHWVNGFIVDGDYLLVKVNKRTLMRTEEYVWNEVVPPLLAPEGEGTPTLIDPDNPFYIWIRKPGRWHPCWLRWEGTNLVLVDMLTGETIGRGTPCPLDAVAVSGGNFGQDQWAYSREQAALSLRAMGYSVVELSMPTKARVTSELQKCSVWYSVCHGGPTEVVLQMDPEGNPLAVLKASDVEQQLVDREPYAFAFIGSCMAMTDKGEGTWSQAFTRNGQGGVVVGYRDVYAHMDAWVWNIYWEGRFFSYLSEGWPIRDAFEASVADYPDIAPIVDIYEGTGPPVVTHTLTLAVSPSGGGYTSPAVGSHTYDEGTSVTLEARPHTSYEFDHWEVTFIQSGVTVPSYSRWNILPMTEDIQAVAYFKRIGVVTYTLSTSVTPSGSGTVSPSSGTYDEGSIVTLTATPRSGYEFDHWEGTDNVYINPTTVTMDSDKHVVANFTTEEAAPSDITAILGPLMLVAVMGMMVGIVSK